MSKPMLIPKDLPRFRHPHIGRPYGGTLADPTGLHCTTDRPDMDPELVRYWRDIGETSMRVWLPCGTEVRWEFPDV